MTRVRSLVAMTEQLGPGSPGFRSARLDDAAASAAPSPDQQPRPRLFPRWQLPSLRRLPPPPRRGRLLPHTGYVWKKSGGKHRSALGLNLGNRLDKWDRRYFECRADGTLFWLKSAGEADPLGQIDLRAGASVYALPNEPRSFVVHTAERLLTIRAADTHERTSWVRALMAAGCLAGPGLLDDDDEQMVSQRETCLTAAVARSESRRSLAWETRSSPSSHPESRASSARLSHRKSSCPAPICSPRDQTSATSQNMSSEAGADAEPASPWSHFVWHPQRTSMEELKVGPVGALPIIRES